ncbi:hypothetical protein J18TS1_04510 [Oceanobacillus oncorhynchi subsp. incaldanensis]|uniref:RNA polymerase sigma factor SigA n=1 Tax=Oceanobacillus oncorhynchi TaxID=545501 RepID=A0A0A1MKH2_9BACI|nr:hypothetical protein J18TS1_04510 [Oceanobacillus oncorhynchi subsp. incaldanensis]CEI83603.1 RNA polymerase sigma factor SigA [Oceanobacillus oncorhynchi]
METVRRMEVWFHAHVATHKATMPNTIIPIKYAADGLLKKELEEVLDTLPLREESILRLRFGLDDGKSRTLEELGKVFGVTRERVRQLETKALRKLRHLRHSKRLKDFLD